MEKKPFLALCFWLFLFLPTLKLVAQQHQKPEEPNIIFILGDEMR